MSDQPITLIIAIALWGCFILSFGRDRSRYRNCYLLFFALCGTAVAILSLGGEMALLVFLLMILILLAILLVPLLLVINGIQMMKREGRSLSNLLSLLLGLIVGAGELSTVIYIISRGITYNAGSFDTILQIVSFIISISVIYGSVSFVIFMLYSLFLMIIPSRKDFDYVIIHGAGLIGGSKVSKLLSDRIDKAIDIYHRDPTPPILIPSGGKGSDEDISEAEAMAAYLIEKGIPEDHIRLEDKSDTTLENLRNSKAIIDSSEGRKYTALVSSNYHVYRALRYCRKIGLDCTGIGSRVAFYYWPSALIREYIAIHAEKKHAISFFLGWIIMVAVTIWIIL